MALTDAASPSTRYMWVSLVLGYVFLAWFFFECDLCSRWLVVLGMPLAIMITLLLWRYRGTRGEALDADFEGVHHEALIASDASDQDVQEAEPDSETAEVAEVAILEQHEALASDASDQDEEESSHGTATTHHHDDQDVQEAEPDTELAEVAEGSDIDPGTTRSPQHAPHAHA